MRLGIFAKTFPGTDPRRVLESVRASGYAVAQWNWACAGLPSMPDEISGETLDAVRRASDATEIAIPAVSGTFNMAHPDRDVRQTGLRRLLRIIETAPRIGAGVVTLCTGSRDADDQWAAHPDNDTEAAWSDMWETMRPALDAAERLGVTLGIEPELANVVTNAARAERLIEEAGSERIGIVLDAANLFETATDAERRSLVEDAIARLGPRIVMAHAKDRLANGGFVAAGRGVLDYGHYLRRLRDAGFGGDLVTHGLAPTEAASVASFLRDRLDAKDVA